MKVCLLLRALNDKIGPGRQNYRRASQRRLSAQHDPCTCFWQMLHFTSRFSFSFDHVGPYLCHVE